MDLEKLKNKFSNKQIKLQNKIEKLIGRDPSIGLVSLQGVERTSQSEIEVVANLIVPFKPIEILIFQETPRKITLIGVFLKVHKIKIIPQYRVKNYVNNNQDWAIDLVLELHRPIGNEFVKIASLGIEYDGYPSHYVESKIKSTYSRDINILSESGVCSIRISPESWKREPENIKKAIKKYFKHKIKDAESVQRKTIDALHATSKYRKFTQCPICVGERKLANDFCPACKGVGAVFAGEWRHIDESQYVNFDCPECRGNRSTCRLCNGAGYISREKALEWQEKHV